MVIHTSTSEVYGTAQYVPIDKKHPKQPKSNYVIIGLYFYPNSVVKIAQKVRSCGRGELEITLVNQAYLEKQNMKLQEMSRDYAWLNTGTHKAVSEATEFVKAVEKRTSLKIAC
jgi:glucose-1-phosphate thymidylyltransferase